MFTYIKCVTFILFEQIVSTVYLESNLIYPDRSDVFFDHLWRLAAPTSVYPSANVVQSLGSGNDVERWRHRPSILKVGYPKFASRKFPLRVSFFLRYSKFNLSNAFRLSFN